MGFLKIIMSSWTYSWLQKWILSFHRMLITVHNPTGLSRDASRPILAKCECLEVKFLLKVPYVLFLVGTLLPPDHIIPQAPSRHRPLDFSLLSPKHILSKTKPVAELDQDHIPNIHLPFHVPLRSVGRNLDVGDICAGSSGDAGR
jgi:hypothetical protein